MVFGVFLAVGGVAVLLGLNRTLWPTGSERASGGRGRSASRSGAARGGARLTGGRAAAGSAWAGVLARAADPASAGVGAAGGSAEPEAAGPAGPRSAAGRGAPRAAGAARPRVAAGRAGPRAAAGSAGSRAAGAADPYALLAGPDAQSSGTPARTGAVYGGALDRRTEPVDVAATPGRRRAPDEDEVFAGRRSAEWIRTERRRPVSTTHGRY